MVAVRLWGLACFLVAVGRFQESSEPVGPLRARYHRKDEEIAKIEENKSRLLPTVFIALLVSNQAHTLPQFLAYIERLDYPTNRISIGIYTDHNVDNSSAMLQEWVANVQHLYHNILLADSDELVYTAQPLEWTTERYQYIMKLRESLWTSITF
jgi:collagen beta-1,O-galactosyltransferase